MEAFRNKGFAAWITGTTGITRRRREDAAPEFVALRAGMPLTDAERTERNEFTQRGEITQMRSGRAPDGAPVILGGFQPPLRRIGLGDVNRETHRPMT